MKKIKYTLTALILLTGFSFSSFAQSTITGHIQDENKQPVGYATVTLLKVADSALIKGAITNASGDYTFSGVPSGKYRVAASMIGLIRTYSTLIEVGDGHSTGKVATLVLKHNANQLSGVSVTASKPFIEQKAGKTILNVQRFYECISQPLQRRIEWRTV